MIKSLVHAALVQAQRSKSGKRGYAKAVRRYLLKNHEYEYRELLKELAVVWPDKAQEAA